MIVPIPIQLAHYMTLLSFIYHFFSLFIIPLLTLTSIPLFQSWYVLLHSIFIYFSLPFQTVIVIFIVIVLVLGGVSFYFKKKSSFTNVFSLSLSLKHC
ncbi:hypothetical protein HOY80DRAFT_979498 [Tuber brumale]|nr:hypothetical protein HOY80DRAFT_979498 [Tuber brumale]